MTEYLIRDDGKVIVEKNSYTANLPNFSPYVIKEAVEVVKEDEVVSTEDTVAKPRGRPAKNKE